MLEKMLAGELYLANDPELIEMRDRAQQLLYKFNTSPPHATEQQETIIKTLFGSIGSGFEIRPTFQCDYGSNIYIGDRFYANFDCVILDCNTVRIGNNCFLAPKVQIYTAAHPLNPKERSAGWEYALPITVGNDVWIGGGAILCPGVSIGDGTTIGAGSVVTKDLPSGVVAAGNPCRILRELPQE